jgi:hypothetical protein
MVWGATLIVEQALDWGISVDKAATTMNYGLLLQGIGGLMAIPLIEAYGRYKSFQPCRSLSVLPS